MKKIAVDVLEIESGFVCLNGHDSDRSMSHAILLIPSPGEPMPEVMTVEEARNHIKTAWVMAVQGKTKHEVEEFFKSRHGITL